MRAPAERPYIPANAIEAARNHGSTWCAKNQLFCPAVPYAVLNRLPGCRQGVRSYRCAESECRGTHVIAVKFTGGGPINCPINRLVFIVLWSVSAMGECNAREDKLIILR